MDQANLVALVILMRGWVNVSFRAASKIFLLVALGLGLANANGEDHETDDLKLLFDLLTGEFDSAEQLRAEVATNTPEDTRHGQVYRSFLPIQAPKVGSHLLVSTVRYGGREGRFDDGEFQVWALTPKGDDFEMVPRHFLDPDRFLPGHRTPETFAGLKPSDLKPSTGGASCAIQWRRTADGFRGITDPPCPSLSTTKGVVLNWEWSYSLDSNAMWINYAGRNDQGEILSGRADQMPWRLQRMD